MKMKVFVAAFFAVIFSLKAADPILPNPKLTPGAVFTNVTVEQITTKGYANKLHGGVRRVSEAEKRQIFIEYFGKIPTKPGNYEVDHLISLELGGSNDPKNLWPESYLTKPYNAHVKDKVEDRMVALVRQELKKNGHEAATKLLRRFQNEISTNWIVAYHKYVSTKP